MENKKIMKQEIANRTQNDIFEFFSPARINLIGEHIDYVGGLVIPASIDLGITAFATKSKNIEIKSIGFTDKWVIKDDFDFDIKYDPKNSFMNFVYGCLIELKKEVGDKINNKSGFKLILSSTIPVASGLSSSAAFGMLILEILNNFYELNISKIKMAQIFQKVENNFIGLKSGIMDQFAIGMGKKDNFIKLNTRTLDYEYVETNLNNYKFILFSTNKSRELATSGYNQRVSELTEVSKELSIPFAELSRATFDDVDKIRNEKLKKRLQHVVSEVERVNKIVEKLKNIDGKNLGAILNKSHYSLRDDYEVSCLESDFIQENLNKMDTVYGSRMIGAGFGGCLLAVVDNNFNINSINFKDAYKQKFNIDFDIYEFAVSNGVRKV